MHSWYRAEKSSKNGFCSCLQVHLWPKDSFTLWQESFLVHKNIKMKNWKHFSILYVFCFNNSFVWLSKSAICLHFYLYQLFVYFSYLLTFLSISAVSLLQLFVYFFSYLSTILSTSTTYFCLYFQLFVYIFTNISVFVHQNQLFVYFFPISAKCLHFQLFIDTRCFLNFWTKSTILT